jgi:hypothetical protein
VPEATINLGSSTVTSVPYTTEQLATRVIPIRFTNTDSRSVKVTLEATTPTATPLNYKIYEGTVPTSQTDCTNDPEGTFQNGTKAEILETVTNKTELVVFVANTDFATASSFTVKVEAPDNSTAPHINFNPVPIQKTLEFKGTTSVSVDLGNTGNGDLTYSYEYVPEATTPSTVSPGTWLGVSVSDGGLASASARSVRSKAIVTPGRKSILNFNLACPADPNYVSGASLKKLLFKDQKLSASGVAGPPPPSFPEYTTTLKVTSDDPNTPSTEIPIRLLCRSAFAIVGTRTPEVAVQGPTGMGESSFTFRNITDAPVSYVLTNTTESPTYYLPKWFTLLSPRNAVLLPNETATVQFQGSCFEGGRRNNVSVFVASSKGPNSFSSVYVRETETLVGDLVFGPSVACFAPNIIGFSPREEKVYASTYTYGQSFSFENNGLQELHYTLSYTAPAGTDFGRYFSVHDDAGKTSGVALLGTGTVGAVLEVSPRPADMCPTDLGAITIRTNDPIHPVKTLKIVGECNNFPKQDWYWGKYYTRLATPDVGEHGFMIENYSIDHCGGDYAVSVGGLTFIGGSAYGGNLEFGVLDVQSMTYVPGFSGVTKVLGYDLSTYNPDVSGYENELASISKARADADKMWEKFVALNCH